MKFEELESPLLSTGGEATSTGSTPRLWLVAIVISFGGFLFGYNSTALNGPITQGDPGSIFELNDVEKQVATAMLLVGALKGALFVNYPSERFGRRKVLLVNNIFFLIGALVCGVANWVWLLAIGRWITGLGVGVVSVLVPQLLSEISPTKIRGMVTTLHQLQITIGIAFAQLIYFGFQRIDNGWRYSVALAGVPAVLQVVLMAVIPESPQWALAHQSEAEALAILQTLRPQTNYNLQEELNDMKATLEEQKRASSGSWSDLFQNKKALVIAIGGNFVQTLTGINAVMYYSSTIFKFCGITEDKLATIGLTGLNVLVTVVSVFVIDRFGRKPLLLTGTSIMFLSLSVAGVLLVGSKTSAIQERDDELKYVTLAMVFIYVVGFAFGLGAVLWSLLGEVFPNNVRSKGMSLCLVINWSLNLLLTLTVLTAIKGMGGGDSESKVGAGGVFLIFAGLALIGLVFMYFVFPETKGKTVEEIQQELRD